MQYQADSIPDYIKQIPSDRQPIITQLIETVNQSIPEGFEQTMSYNMPGWVVPLSRYPAGYHCDPSLPLPFASVASQKHFIALYHMGMYANPKLFDWFKAAYEDRYGNKLNAGKSCLRFKVNKPLPYDLIGKLMSKMTVEQWIALYEKNLMKK